MLFDTHTLSALLITCTLGYIFPETRVKILSLVFDPIEEFIDWLNRWDGDLWSLKGNFRPIDKEQ